MYVRPQGSMHRGSVRLPQNYSGNAFREPLEAKPEPQEISAEADVEESLLRTEQYGSTAPLLATERSAAPANTQKGQIGSEELLLLALALLLADSDLGSELVPLLVLLLFVK